MINNKFDIIGGNNLIGEIENQTSKNAILPILSASLLAEGDTTIYNCPNILDFKHMVDMLKNLGVSVKEENNCYIFNADNINNLKIDFDLSKTMRSSIFLLGSLLSRFKKIMLTTPGGCNIGKRPIDMHISALKRLGVEVEEVGDFLFFNAHDAHSNTVKLQFPSVGATENIIQFACTLPGKTTILNAACEPEIVDLCNFLNKMGAKIIGSGTSKITIYGVNKLKGVHYAPMGDRIVSGTLMIAVAICGGNVVIKNACPHENSKLIEILASMGCQIKVKNDIIHIIRQGRLKAKEEIITGVYPEFPTDLQSLMLALSCVVYGKTKITETIFENRFLVVSELRKMGASIETENCKQVNIFGVPYLEGAQVVARDLRGGAALVLAGLGAKGKTIVEGIDLIDRGYDNFEDMLSKLGANIKRI